MPPKKHFLLALALCLALACCGYSAAGQEEAAPPPPNQSIDRTDFPHLYLADPVLQGEAVWMVQARLRELGYDIEPNGFYDQATSDLVRMFQVAHGLTADGQVTPAVWEALMGEEEDHPTMAGGEDKPKRVIEVDIVKHRLTLYEGEQVLKTFPIGVGKSSTPSPVGEFKVIQKSAGWGGGFGTRWMGLNVPWGIYGIHGTNKPYSVGQSLSHGCIRMRNRDVEALYPLVSVGTPVRMVANGKITPSWFKGRELKIKTTGQDVVYLQYRLKEKGIVFDNADGRYGNMTELAVKYYQIWRGLPVTGKGDAATYRSLGLLK
ncbi:MAG: peptidoglycan-binding protein [Syntrophomonadaceae bacterium]